MGFYDRHILPHVLNFAMSAKPIAYQRRKVVPLAEGRVLEIGIGAGHNLEHYDRSKVTRLWGLEPSPELRAKAAARARALGMSVAFIDLPGERIPLDDGAADTVLVTYTLCTIPDVLTALSGMRRVLKPGGKLIFCEHGRAPDEGVRRWQDRLDRVWGAIAGGCHLNRDMPALLSQGGFAVETLQTMYLPGTPRFAGYNYWGVARPR